MTDRADSQESVDAPFPLRRRFRRRIVPALIAFIGLSLLIIGLTASWAVQAIYLELAQRRAQSIALSVSENAPAPWLALMSGQSLADLGKTEDAARLARAFADEARRRDLVELKIYDLDRRVLYATHEDEIGSTENGEALVSVIEQQESGLVTKTLADGTEQYELYVPVFDGHGALRAVFELYEPVDYLNAILLRSAAPIIALPGALFLVLALALNRLVSGAQRDINHRTDAINELRARIESFVSSTAVDAAREASGGMAIPSRKVTTTLFFSDIRDFTGFAESNTPEDVVGFLNRIMALQVDILKRHGGDVDKMIGDAVLARFDGDDGGRRAVAAAREILGELDRTDLPRTIGIGIYRGDVISGAIGPEDRRDFTVIGDAVNIASRLCSAAAAGEIVADAALADADFAAPEALSVKGRQGALSVRRLKISGDG